MLAEKALAVEQRDADDRQAQVGHRAERVAGEHAEAAAVSRDRRVERDLHREVGDGVDAGRFGLQATPYLLGRRSGARHGLVDGLFEGGDHQRDVVLVDDERGAEHDDVLGAPEPPG